jgi:aminoglycoside phosphotransferase (APT) family kinase protein
MITDVVRTREEARESDRAPLLVLEPLEAFLDALGLGSGPVEATPIGDGHSNVTFLVRRGPAAFVLRRPPRPPLPPGAHDIVREARLLQALAKTDVPVPAVLGVCEDPEVIGAPFVVMDFVEGWVPAEELPAELREPGTGRRIGDAIVDALVAVHGVDLDASGLDWLGRRGGYLERQLRRFSGSWEHNKTRELPAMAELERELRLQLPASSDVALVHGDFRLGNTIYAPPPSIRVAALLDWEMSTIGDPLADVGYLCATWTDRRDRVRPSFHLSPLTGSEGFPTRDELVERYEQRSGRRVVALHWYTALALWKAAVFMEGNYRRAAEGMTDDPWVLGFREGVEELAELGLRVIRTRSTSD